MHRFDAEAGAVPLIGKKVIGGSNFNPYISFKIT
jgi:hypothetical protein